MDDLREALAVLAPPAFCRSLAVSALCLAFSLSVRKFESLPTVFVSKIVPLSSRYFFFLTFDSFPLKLDRMI
jgi:hypothetical protein